MFSDFMQCTTKSKHNATTQINNVWIHYACLDNLCIVVLQVVQSSLMMDELASWSWMLLFQLDIQSCTFWLEIMIFYVNFLLLKTMWTVRLLGPFSSLCLVQACGFPFLMSVHAVYGFIMLCGSNHFAKHWLFFQDAITMCNAMNPAVMITDSKMNFVILCCALAIGIAVMMG
jgi:hypothetical protein